MTVVTVQSDVDAMRFDGTTRFQPHVVWGLESMDGWDGTPAVRESPVARPQADGSYSPSRLTVDSRVLTIRCIVKCGSTLEADMVKDRVNNLMARPLTITVASPVGSRQVSGYLSADPATTMIFFDHALKFSLIVSCPDPLKYGQQTSFTGSKGLISVHNPGLIAVWPTVTVQHRMQSLTLTSGAQRVTWVGDTYNLSLDFADMTPSQGIIREDDAFPIPPGMSYVGYEAIPDTPVTMSIRPAWR